MPRAFLLILTSICYGPYWASRHALSANALREEEAVFVVILVTPYGWRNHNVCDDRAGSHGLALGGDQAITEAEGA